MLFRSAQRAISGAASPAVASVIRPWTAKNAIRAPASGSSRSQTRQRTATDDPRTASPRRLRPSCGTRAESRRMVWRHAKRTHTYIHKFLNLPQADKNHLFFWAELPKKQHTQRTLLKAVCASSTSETLDGDDDCNSRTAVVADLCRVYFCGAT